MANSAADRARRRKEKQLARERQLRKYKIAAGAAGVLFIGVLIIVLSIHFRAASRREREAERERKEEDAQEALLSDAVLEYRDLVREYADQEGISGYVPVLLAIMETETRGTGSQDVMQSSVSGGYAPNSLGPEESIEQACIYFASLLWTAEEKGCDLGAVIQAYNFGPDYLQAVSENGGVHTLELAEEYAGRKSGGETVTYTAQEAVDHNGGWRYAYGNMFYEQIVRRYLPEDYTGP